MRLGAAGGGVDGDGGGGLVAGAVLDEVDEGDVRLVAEGDEAGEAQCVGLAAQLQFEGEVAALAEQGDRAGGEAVGGEVQLGGVVGDAEAVGADEDGSGGPHPVGDRPLAGHARGPGLGEARGDGDDRLRPAGQRVVDGGFEARAGNRDHHQFDGFADRGEGGGGGPAEDGAAAPVDQVHGPPVGGAQGLGGHGVAVLRRIVAGADDGDRAGVEECGQITAHVIPPGAGRSWGSSRRRRGPRPRRPAGRRGR